MFIYPYVNGSGSVNRLKEIMDIKSIKLTNSKFKPSKDKTVINWGCSGIPKEIVDGCNLINHPMAVKVASNKLFTLTRLEDENIPHPPFSTEVEEAIHWLNEGKIVVGREILNGHSGNGIVLFEGKESLDNLCQSNLPLYTLYIPKIEEYRLHVMGDEVILVQKKGVLRNFIPNDYRIRNHDNGFIFIKNNVDVSQVAKDICVKTIQTLGLDFGAVDLIYNKYRDQYYVLEVNTAPGMEGSTGETYAQGFNKFFNVPLKKRENTNKVELKFQRMEIEEED